MKLYTFWLLQSSKWVEQPVIKAKNRKAAAKIVGATHNKGWKIRLQGDEE